MSKGRILVVDDEEDILELVKYNLEREGYLVDCVDTGEEAIERAVAIRPDGILLDLMLPGVDGIEVCRELRKNPDTRTIPIIMMTAKGEEADVVSGLEVGADDYVPKPFSTKVLVARLRPAPPHSRRDGQRSGRRDPPRHVPAGSRPPRSFHQR